MFETIIVEKVNSITTVTLNRPDRLNAIDMKMREELNSVFQDINRDTETRVVILCGKGKAFCAGGDVNTMGGFQPNDGRLRMKNAQVLIRLILTMDKPVIAAIHGYAMGAGMNLAMACDLIIASDDVKLSQSFTKIGLVPDWGGFYTIPRRVGITKAMELMMLAPIINADTAVNLGLINKVVKSENLMEEAKSIAYKLASGPKVALALCKTIINKSLGGSLEDCFEYEAMAQDICMQTKDFNEGIAALLEKRLPDFIK